MQMLEESRGIEECAEVADHIHFEWNLRASQMEWLDMQPTFRARLARPVPVDQTA
jgi:hypothetical protein